MALPVFKSFLWVSIEKFLVLGIQFVGTVILARLIGPDEFGMVGILTVFIAIANMLTDSGMGGSLVREESITPVDYHTLFIYNGAISVFIYLILFIAAPFISTFYKIPELCEILRVLGLSVIFTSLSITQSIHLLRELKFRLMTLCATISSLLAVTTAVIMAYCNMGVWALVSQTVAYSIFYTISLFIVVKYVPKLVFDKISFKRQFSYGINILGANIVHTIQTNISTSIVGKFFSLSSTGYYTQASRLHSLPNNIVVSIIDKAAFPIMSKHYSVDEKVQITDTIGRYIYILAFPLWGFCFIMSEPLIKTILGNVWIESAWMFSILCLAGPFYSIKTILRSIFKTTGDTKVILRVDTISSLLGILFMIIASFISLRYLVCSVVLTAFISMFYYMYEVKACYHYSIRRQFVNIMVVLIPTILACLSLHILKSTLPFLSYGIIGLGLSFIIFAILCCLLYLCFRNKEFSYLCCRLLKRK